MKKLVFLLFLFMLILAACATTHETTTKDFDKVFDDSPVDLRGR